MASIPNPPATIFPATDDNLALAVEVLSAGGLVGLPTETVYGLAANAWQPEAVRKIYLAKGRPSHNPLIVHVAEFGRLAEAIAWPPEPVIAEQLARLASFWPGPLTVVCPRAASIPDAVTAGRSTVAVRIPAHDVATRLLARCPFPLAAPSANRSGYVSPTRPEHLRDRSGLADAISMVLDGGPCIHGVESTIVLLGEQPRLLRPGSITAEQLAERLGVAVTSLVGESQHAGVSRTAGGPEKPWRESAGLGRPPEVPDRTALAAPGMLREHYAPRTPLRLLAGERGQAPSEGGGRFSGGAEIMSGIQTGGTARLGRIAFGPLTAEQAASYVAVETLSDRGDLVSVARNLFAALRRLDDLGLDRIDCDTCPPVGLGRAIMDRLDRAAARWRSDSPDGSQAGS